METKRRISFETSADFADFLRDAAQREGLSVGELIQRQFMLASPDDDPFLIEAPDHHRALIDTLAEGLTLLQKQSDTLNSTTNWDDASERLRKNVTEFSQTLQSVVHVLSTEKAYNRQH